jgi:hypothetical protein
MLGGILGGLQSLDFFWGRKFAKFRPKIYHFNLYKRIYNEKNDPNLPDFEGFFFQITRFYDEFQ